MTDDKKPDLEVLKSVFTYGYATDTHLDIVCYLNVIGIPEEEYSQWGRNARVKKEVQNDRR